jgi:hypothetical protein
LFRARSEAPAPFGGPGASSRLGRAGFQRAIVAFVRICSSLWLCLVVACAGRDEPKRGPTHPPVDIVIDVDSRLATAYPEEPEGCSCNPSLARDGCGGGFQDNDYGACRCHSGERVVVQDLLGCIDDVTLDDKTHHLTLAGCGVVLPLDDVDVAPPHVADFSLVAGADEPQVTFDGGRAQVCTSFDGFWDSCCDATDAPVPVRETWRDNFSVRGRRLVGPFALADVSGTTRVWWLAEGEHAYGAVTPILRSDGLEEAPRGGRGDALVFDPADPTWFSIVSPELTRVYRSDIEEVRVLREGKTYAGEVLHALREVTVPIGTLRGEIYEMDPFDGELTNVDDETDVIAWSIAGERIRLPGIARLE